MGITHREHREGSSFPWATLEPRSTGIARDVVAAILIGAALLLRLVLGRWLGPNVPYLQFFPVILLASWYGGLGPRLFATAPSAGAAIVLFFSSTGWGVARSAELISLTWFILTGQGLPG